LQQSEREVPVKEKHTRLGQVFYVWQETKKAKFSSAQFVVWFVDFYLLETDALHEHKKKCLKIEEGWTNKEDALKAGKNFAVRLAILQSILVCFGSFSPEYSQDKKKSKEYQTTEHKKVQKTQQGKKKANKFLKYTAYSFAGLFVLWSVFGDADKENLDQQKQSQTKQQQPRQSPQVKPTENKPEP